MKRFKRKALEVVGAEQYNKERHISEGLLPKGVERRFITGEDGAQYEGMPELVSRHGSAVVEDGAWVVTYGCGDRQLFSDRAFRQLFEEID